MKYFLFAFAILSLSACVVYSQVNDIPCQDVPSDTTDCETHIRGELSLTETLGGRISGSTFNGDEAFTAATLGADFYLIGGLTFGPEFGIFVDGTTLPLFGLNLGYTHWWSGRRGIYLRLGYDFASSLEAHSSTDSRSIFTAGAGMKFPMGAKSLFRLEVSYKHQWRKNNPQIYFLDKPTPSDTEIIRWEYEEYKTKGSIGILIGFSAIIR